jgi:flavin reductase (DIM6/NTAB) family NADH-FMN oxidoreductase RutF
VELSGAFREAMGHLAATVVMVTVELDGRPWGLTISACCSVSATPPMILISLGEQTATAKRISEDGRFGLSILSEHQLDAAQAGAAPGVPKFVEDFCAPGELEDSPTEMPMIRGAAAHLDCVVAQSTEVADHVVFFAEVKDVVLSDGGTPLLYWKRTYTAVDRGEQWYH